MATKQKMVEELTNGEKIDTTKEGWNPEEIRKSGRPILVAGWNSNPHFGVDIGFCVAALKERKEELYVGEYDVGDGKTVPVIDGKKLAADIKNAYVQAYNLDVQKITIMGDKSGAKKELDEMIGIYSDNPALLEAVKAQSPVLYEKLVKRMEAIEAAAKGDSKTPSDAESKETDDAEETEDEEETEESEETEDEDEEKAE